MIKFERRTLERFSLELPTWLFITNKNEKLDSIELVTSNVCAGGAFYKTENPLPSGFELRLDIIIPLDRLKNLKGKRSRIEVLGSVIRTEKQGMAVCFDKKYKISAYH